MCRECFNYGWLISCWNIDNIVKQMNLALELKLFRAEAIPRICHCLPSSSAWRLPTWETQNLRNVASVDCHDFQNTNNFSYNWLRWLGLSITQSCPYKLPIRQRIAVFWRSSNSQQFGIGGNSRRSIIMSIWLYMSANSICHVCMNDYEILWMSIQCWHPWYFWICRQFSDSQGLAAAEIAVVAAQPKGSLPRAHTCTNESRPWDVQSLQSFTSSRIVIFIASHLKTKKPTVMVCSESYQSYHILSCLVTSCRFSLRLQLPSYDSVEELSTKLREAMENVRAWEHFSKTDIMDDIMMDDIW